MNELPSEIHGPSAWFGLEVAKRNDWIERLSDGEIAEIEAATEKFANSGIDPVTIRPEHFPLFNWHAGLLSAIYHRPYIESARRFPEVACVFVTRWAREQRNRREAKLLGEPVRSSPRMR